jgi:hypothetical protein
MCTPARALPNLAVFAKGRALACLIIFAKGCTLAAYGLGVMDCIVYYKERKQDIMAVEKHITPSEARTLLREARLETGASLVIFPVLCAVSWPFVVAGNGRRAIKQARDNVFKW